MLFRLMVVMVNMFFVGFLCIDNLRFLGLFFFFFRYRLLFLKYFGILKNIFWYLKEIV